MKSHTQQGQGRSAEDGHGLQQEVAAASAWRSEFQKAPTVFLAASFGGGVLIGIGSQRRKSHALPERARDLEAAPNRKSLRWDWNDSISVVKSVLIGIAIAEAKKLLFNRMLNKQTTPAGAPVHPKRPAAHNR